MSRILALDLGSVRIGVAVTDPNRIIASPLKTILFVSDKELINEVLDICSSMEIKTVVVGLPLKEDGTEGTGCEKSRSFASKLMSGGLDVVLWDERYSSKVAAAYLREAGTKNKKARVSLDRIAASLILENYLAYLKRKGTINKL